jgi:hypothetical protein
MPMWEQITLLDVIPLTTPRENGLKGIHIGKWDTWERQIARFRELIHFRAVSTVTCETLLSHTTTSIPYARFSEVAANVRQIAIVAATSFL